MRVIYLASGAAGMYCGSCMRDNRLAATLIAQGRDVVLLPLYTPLRTDEIDVSSGRVYYGGINVYLQNKSSVFRRTPRFVDSLLDSPVLLRGVGRFAANTDPQVLGDLTVAVLKGEHGRHRKELEKLVSGIRALNSSLVNLPNLMFVGTAHRLKTELAVPIVCTLAGEDVFLDVLPEPHRTDALRLIREGAGHVDAFIAPTRYYAQHVIDHFGLDPDRVHVVPLGIGVDDFPEPEPPTDGAFSIGYLARICPEKGLANLCQALVRLREAGRDCRVRAAGYLGQGDKAYLAHATAFLKDRGMADVFEYVGEVSRAEKLEFLRSQHVLSVPSVYHESKGIYVLEAMAAGVPVVQPRIGAFPEFVEQTGGGLLYDPDDEGGLADGIARLMDDSALRESLGRAGRAGVRKSFTADIMARETWALYERVCSAHSDAPTRMS